MISKTIKEHLQYVTESKDLNYLKEDGQLCPEYGIAMEFLLKSLVENLKWKVDWIYATDVNG